MRSAILIIAIALVAVLPTRTYCDPGKVYLVLGSDTAIWEGMDVGRYHCDFSTGLYTDLSRNTYQVMDPAFRQRLVDSFGEPMKLTWWMMAGSIFRPATNTDVPTPNTMTMYLMKAYHGDEIELFGDELSLHYHTFKYTDYDRDGKFWWNQAFRFEECREDFDFTLAQLLLEENVFPVSFRSGWHYMDNDWQQHLDQLLPYSLHNDWPNRHVDLAEPLDNNYNWSQAPAAFIPYRPAIENYQLPGNGRGWNVRSAHFNTVRFKNLMDTVFTAASQGQDQVACFWGHLPESDFLSNLEIIDSLAHQQASKFPEVKFRYCTAVEAMQLWRNAEDNVAPVVTFEEQSIGDSLYFHIQTDEPIFQAQPFVAAKDRYERYSIIPCSKVADNTWRTSRGVTRTYFVKAGVAVSDTLGNLTTRFIRHVPDDIFIDNQDAGYRELLGSWMTTTGQAWGTDARVATLAMNDSASVEWHFTAVPSGNYNLFIRFPVVSNPVEKTTFRIYQDRKRIASITHSGALPTREWVFVDNVKVETRTNIVLELTGFGDDKNGRQLAADVAKLTALVRERELSVQPDYLDLGEVSEGDSVHVSLQLSNQGAEPLTLYDIHSRQETIFTPLQFPLVIDGMRRLSIPLIFHQTDRGIIADTLFINSDDPIASIYAIPVSAHVQAYFRIVDNDDSTAYEEAGQWHQSVTQAHGKSSRYAFLHEIGAYAEFRTILPTAGIYEIFEIVPRTVNSANRALYQLRVAGILVDAIFQDQNNGSGDWVLLWRRYLPAQVEVEIRVTNTGESTAGDVIRADAIKLALLQETTSAEDMLAEDFPREFRLRQNYPNPFNPATTISFSLPHASKVSLQIFNSNGQLVRTLVDDEKAGGHHSVVWNASDDGGRQVAGGLYFCRMKAGKHESRRKLIFIK